MCEVHLVPENDETRKAAEVRTCGECGGLIELGQEFRLVEGPLDDGSGDRYRYEAHEECYALSTYDVGPEGCFTYGGARKLTE